LVLLSKLINFVKSNHRMEVKIIEVSTNEEIPAIISISELLKEMPKKKDGWNFNWRTLFKVEGSEIYKLTLQNDDTQIQGVVMLTLMNDEMLYMNAIEVVPHNYGSKGKFDNVAGCLIAFACLQSIERGKNSYQGYLTFESKTSLIDFYHKKYGATLTMGQRMFIGPQVGENLINQYLDLKI